MNEFELMKKKLHDLEMLLLSERSTVQMLQKEVINLKTEKEEPTPEKTEPVKPKPEKPIYVIKQADDVTSILSDHDVTGVTPKLECEATDDCLLHTTDDIPEADIGIGECSSEQEHPHTALCGPAHRTVRTRTPHTFLKFYHTLHYFLTLKQLKKMAKIINFFLKS